MLSVGAPWERNVSVPLTLGMPCGRQAVATLCAFRVVINHGGWRAFPQSLDLVAERVRQAKQDIASPNPNVTVRDIPRPEQYPQSTEDPIRHRARTRIDVVRRTSVHENESTGRSRGQDVRANRVIVSCDNLRRSPRLHSRGDSHASRPRFAARSPVCLVV